MSWPVTIPKVKDGETTFSATDMNAIIQALEDRTTFLKQNIVNDDIIDGVGFTDIGLDNCRKGQFVAYDKATQMYAPANALWDSYNAIPSDNAYVIGVIVSDIVEGRGTILVSGILRNKSIITSIMGNLLHIPGHYYLGRDGAITQDINSITMPVHCGMLTASGCFTLGIQIPDFRTHNHTKYNLQTTYWKPVADATTDIPDNALYFYDSRQDTTLASILRSTVSGTALVVNNSCLLEYKDYLISDGYIWLLKDFGFPLEGAIYATNPFMGIASWLTAMTVAENNNIIKVNQSGTTAILDTAFPIIDSGRNTGKAIASITNQGLVECPVVNKLTAGAGINITEDPTGTYKIDSTVNLPDTLDFNIINGNGIVLGGDDIILIKFPSQRQSSINGTIRVPSNVKECSARLFMYVEGNGSSVSPGTVSIKPINIPITAEKVVKPTTPTRLTFSSQATPDADSIYLWKTAEDFKVTSGDQLNITIYFDNPPSTINVCSIGLHLQYN